MRVPIHTEIVASIMYNKLYINDVIEYLCSLNRSRNYCLSSLSIYLFLKNVDNKQITYRLRERCATILLVWNLMLVPFLFKWFWCSHKHIHIRKVIINNLNFIWWSEIYWYNFNLNIVEQRQKEKCEIWTSFLCVNWIQNVFECFAIKFNFNSYRSYKIM